MRSYLGEHEEQEPVRSCLGALAQTLMVLKGSRLFRVENIGKRDFKRAGKLHHSRLHWNWKVHHSRWHPDSMDAMPASKPTQCVIPRLCQGWPHGVRDSNTSPWFKSSRGGSREGCSWAWLTL